MNDLVLANQCVSQDDLLRGSLTFRPSACLFCLPQKLSRSSVRLREEDYNPRGATADQSRGNATTEEFTVIVLETTSLVPLF